jgi:hypothetical protein
MRQSEYTDIIHAKHRNGVFDSAVIFGYLLEKYRFHFSVTPSMFAWTHAQSKFLISLCSILSDQKAKNDSGLKIKNVIHFLNTNTKFLFEHSSMLGLISAYFSTYPEYMVYLDKAIRSKMTLSIDYSVLDSILNEKIQQAIIDHIKKLKDEYPTIRKKACEFLSDIVKYTVIKKQRSHVMSVFFNFMKTERVYTVKSNATNHPGLSMYVGDCIARALHNVIDEVERNDYINQLLDMLNCEESKDNKKIMAITLKLLIDVLNEKKIIEKFFSIMLRMVNSDDAISSILLDTFLGVFPALSAENKKNTVHELQKIHNGKCDWIKAHANPQLHLIKVMKKDLEKISTVLDSIKALENPCKDELSKDDKHVECSVRVDFEEIYSAYRNLSMLNEDIRYGAYNILKNKIPNLNRYDRYALARQLLSELYLNSERLEIIACINFFNQLEQSVQEIAPEVFTYGVAGLVIGYLH